MTTLTDSFINQARPELERLAKALNKHLADGRLDDARKDAERIAEITSWAAQVEEVQRKLAAIKPPPPPPPAPVAVATRSRDLPHQPASAPAGPPPVPSSAEAPPEEAPAAEKSRKPPVLPSEPSEEDRLRQRRRALEADVKTFLEKSRDIMGGSSLSLEEEAMAKALIVEGRALEAEAADVKSIFKSSIKDEVLLIGEWWDSVASNREFFGLNQARSHPADVWKEIAEGYQLLAAAEEAVAWLETDPGLTDSQLASILELAACAEACLLRVFDDRALNVWDLQQKAVHTRLEAFEPGPSVTRWWKRTDPPAFDELRKRGHSLRAEVASVRKAKERAQATQQALAALRDYVSSTEGSSFDEEVLVDLTAKALDAGVPPSHKDLRSLLAGYRYLLESSTHRDIQKLVQYMQKDALELIAKKKALVEQIPEEDQVDPDLANKISELLPVTEGRTLLFVGGSKGQGWRKDEYVKALSLKEVIWPDAEEGTKVTDLAGKVSRADIVCLLIRFSRHSYKAVLDEAKSQGKLTVTLPRGYGVNTLIHEMWTQITSGQAAPPQQEA